MVLAAELTAAQAERDEARERGRGADRGVTGRRPRPSRAAAPRTRWRARAELEAQSREAIAPTGRSREVDGWARAARVASAGAHSELERAEALLAEARALRSSLE